MRRYLSAIILVCASLVARAAGDGFSYLYLQGDKQTPFYVKLEDAMQPRFGKNYCIIPRMAPGPAHLEILFQQNIYPPQKFTVLIPESGSRGFLLVKKEDRFMLYDLQQGFYLAPGNTEDDDRMPADFATVPTVEKAPTLEGPLGKPIAKKTENPRHATKVHAQKKMVQPRKETERHDDKPVFIPDLELNNNSKNPGEVIPARDVTAPSGTSSILNTDCPSPITAEAFGKVFTELNAYKTDEDRLEFLGRRMNLCYETWQARTLAGKLEGDAARYELLRKIYSRITDQSAFPLLDDLLTTEVWKAEFSRLVHH